MQFLMSLDYFFLSLPIFISKYYLSLQIVIIWTVLLALFG